MTERDLEDLSLDWLVEAGWERVHGDALSPGVERRERERYVEVVPPAPSA